MGIRLPSLKGIGKSDRALWRTPVGLALIGAFLLPIAVLATVSVISVSQHMEIRSLLTAETYGSIADLAASKLSEGLETWEREMLAEIDGSAWDRRDLISRMQRVERSFPELRPIVLVDPDGEIVYPLRARPADPTEETFARGDFDSLLARAEEIELANGDLALADRTFVQAAGAARSAADKVRALAGLARVRMKAGEPKRAAELYEEITALADPLDPTLARFAVMARLRRGEALEAASDEAAACGVRLDTLRFLQRNRFNLDPELYAYYRAESEAQLRAEHLSDQEREELNRALALESELNAIDDSLTLLLQQLPQLAAVNSADWLGAQPVVGKADKPETGEEPQIAADWQIRYLNLQEDVRGSTVVSLREGSGWQVARRWRPHSVKRVMNWLMGLEGPWQEAGVALLDPSGAPIFVSTRTLPKERVSSRIGLAALPGWKVVAYPRAGSLENIAREDVVGYAVLLSAAFLAVVGALVLATRTVSRQVALANARSEFVSNVSHELKTPLALIRMFSENLRAGWVPEAKKDEYYDVMLGESERLSGVIDNALDFSRIESGGREYELRLTDLNELASEIVDRYRYSFETAGIELEVDIPDTPVTAPADRDAIAQVLVNLLSNAAKYIGDPPRQVRLSLRADAGLAFIEVSDTGVGMTPEDTERIFVPFCRLEHEELKSVAGSGVGLTIVRHIVESHGGHIDVESTPGEGSCFTIALPLEAEASPFPDSEPDP